MIANETALLIVDVISDFEFEDGEIIFRSAKGVAQNIRKLKSKFARSGLPVIYVNDTDEGKIKTVDELFEKARSTRKGIAIFNEIKPEHEKVLLKPQRSGFFGTDLSERLKKLNIKNVTVTGWTTDICVLFTAHDAFMRKMNVAVPSDCSTALRPTHHEDALRFLKRVAEADVSRAAK